MIKPDEIVITGKWIVKNSTVVEDQNCKRIRDLITGYLTQVTKDSSGWDTLYRDSTDSRLWELVYIESELSGGGPPTLIHVTKEFAKEKYGVT